MVYADSPGALAVAGADLTVALASFPACSVPATRRGRRPYPARALADPDLARDRCASAAYAFHDHLRRFRPPGPDGGLPGATMLTVRLAAHPEVNHRVNEVDGLVVDWTARQFEPTAAWPLVEPLARFLGRCLTATDFYDLDRPLLPPEAGSPARAGRPRAGDGCDGLR